MEEEMVDWTTVKCDNPDCDVEMVPLTAGNYERPCLKCNKGFWRWHTVKRPKKEVDEFYENL